MKTAGFKKLVAIAMFGCVAAAATPALADSAKCTIDVTIKNKKATAVKVIKFEYQIENGGWKSEDLGNHVLNKNGGSNTWKKQTLNFASEGVFVSHTRVIYQDDTGRGWSGNKTAASYAHTTKCTDGANYHQDVP